MTETFSASICGVVMLSAFSWRASQEEQKGNLIVQHEMDKQRQTPLDLQGSNELDTSHFERKRESSGGQEHRDKRELKAIGSARRATSGEEDPALATSVSFNWTQRPTTQFEHNRDTLVSPRP